MKKITLFFTFIIIFIFLVFPSNAQEKQLSYGLRLGPQMTLTNIDVSPLDPVIRMTFAFGGLVEYNMSPNFALQMNVLYNPKGAKYKEEISVLGYTASAELTWQFNYLSFPILAKATFGDETKLYLFAGPELGFLLSANAILKTESNVPGAQDTEDEEDIKEYMNSTEICLNGGFGIQFPMQNMTVFIESRGCISISDIVKDHAALGIEEGTAMNIIGAFHFGVLF